MAAIRANTVRYSAFVAATLAATHWCPARRGVRLRAPVHSVKPRDSACVLARLAIRGMVW
jgi:hypothetical protein